MAFAFGTGIRNQTDQEELLPDYRYHAVFTDSYEYPNLIGTDYVVFIAAPGRTTGRGPNGHADVIGNVMDMTSNVVNNTADANTSTAQWTSSGSFEGHGWNKSSVTWTFSLMNKYGKQGLRCAYP